MGQTVWVGGAGRVKRAGTDSKQLVMLVPCTWEKRDAADVEFRGSRRFQANMFDCTTTQQLTGVRQQPADKRS